MLIVYLGMLFNVTCNDLGSNDHTKFVEDSTCMLVYAVIYM